MEKTVYLAAMDGNVNFLREVREQEIESGCWDNFFRSSLTPQKNNIIHIASQYDQFHFLECGFNLMIFTPLLISQRNANGDTPVHVASKRGNKKIVRLLVETSMKFGYREVSISNEVAEEDEDEGEIRAWRVRNSKGNTALHEALINGKLDVAQFLVGFDEDLATFVNEDGETPLHLAVRYSVYELAISRFTQEMTELTSNIENIRFMLQEVMEEGTVQVPSPPSKKNSKKDRLAESMAENDEEVVEADHLNDAFGDGDPTSEPFAGYNPIKPLGVEAGDDEEHLFRETEDEVQGQEAGDNEVANEEEEEEEADEYAGLPFTDLPMEVKMTRTHQAVTHMHSLEADAEVIKKEKENFFIPLRETFFDLSTRIHGLAEVYGQTLANEGILSQELEASRGRVKDLTEQIDALKSSHETALRMANSKATSAVEDKEAAEKAKKKAEEDLTSVRLELENLKKTPPAEPLNPDTIIQQWRDGPAGKKWRDEAALNASSKVSDLMQTKMLAAAERVMPGKKEEILQAFQDLIAAERTKAKEKAEKQAQQSKERTEAARKAKAAEAQKTQAEAARRANVEASQKAAEDLKKSSSGGSKGISSSGGKVFSTASGMKINLKRSSTESVPSVGVDPARKKPKTVVRPPGVKLPSGVKPKKPANPPPTPK